MINKIVAFGCSFVKGDTAEHRFRYVPYTEKPLAIYYLGKELGLDRDKCDIMAHSGHSNQYIYRDGVELVFFYYEVQPSSIIKF